MKRNCSVMIAGHLEGVVDSDSFKDLMLRKDEFTWINPADGHCTHDGPTMLKILMTTVNPTTHVGMTTLKNLIQEARLPKFGHDIKVMLNNMESHYKKTKELGQTYEDWTMHLFDALASGKNKVFTDSVQRNRDDWECGIEVKPASLILEAKAKYTNMVSLKTWN